ncbi:MAG: transcription termination factor NusA [Athalassotoga sp.]|uniref:transcription termination factor NusA n=1 Tax=Athalassotoga sp. TaxID=2022597 RepID=UPI003D0924A9
MLNLNLLEALEQLQGEKNMSRDEVIEILERALTTAYKKNFNVQDDNLTVKIDSITGEINVFENVEEKNEDGLIQTKVVRETLNTKKFGRIAAQTAKQVLIQKLKEIERENLFQEYMDLYHTVVSAEVIRPSNGDVDLRLNKVDAVLPAKERIPGEKFYAGQFVKSYVMAVEKKNKGPVVILSRVANELVQKLFEKYVPEIEGGIVKIVAIAREPGSRTKMAVISTDPNVDPVGSCIGEGGSRVGQVIKELNGEKIDIVSFSSEPVQFVSNALSPAKVMDISLSENDHRMYITVSPTQISLAIGKDGQNVRLASKLTGWKIEIRQFMGEGFKN